jgi:hypothetical protein
VFPVCVSDSLLNTGIEEQQSRGDVFNLNTARSIEQKSLLKVEKSAITITSETDDREV